MKHQTARLTLAVVISIWSVAAQAQDLAPLDTVRIEGLSAWNINQADLADIRVRVLPVPGGFIAAEQDDDQAELLTLAELISRDAEIDRSLEAVIAEAVAGWMLRAKGRDVTPQPRPNSTRDNGRLLIDVPAPGPAEAEAGPFRLNQIIVEGLSGDAITEAEALALPVDLTPVETDGENAWIQPRLGLPVETFAIGDLAGGQPLYASALQEMGRAIVQAYNALGYRGVRVQGRTPEDGIFRLVVTEGRVSQIRTSATVEEREPVRDAPEHRRLAENAPVQEGQLVDLQALDRYVYHLGRRPGRRVDLALSPGVETDEVVLDLLIAENDPLLFYLQLSNTGTEETTDWRERAGLIHYNLTGVDDVLNVDFLTGDLDEVNALSASYERPFKDLGRAWWRVYGSALEYSASELGFAGDSFEGESYSLGLEARWNLLQDRAFFIDGLLGARWDHVRVKNNIAGTIGEADFLLPYAGFRAEENSERGSFRAFTGVEWNIAGFAGTDGSEVNQLGRPLADDDFAVLRADLDWSFYLEPLLVPDWEASENPTLAHELALSLRGLTSLSNRLPPNYSLTAGGFFTVRGYPESFAFGDNVLVGSLEYRFHVPRSLPPADPGELFGDPFQWRPQQPLQRPDWDFILRGFLDVAHLEIEDRLSFEDDATLLSAGVGVELSVLRNVNLRLDWGFALLDEQTATDEVEAGDSRLHVLLTVFF